MQALRAERSLNPRPEAVSDEQFAASEFLDARDLVQVKYEMVRRARVDGEPVSARGGRSSGSRARRSMRRRPRWMRAGWPGWCRRGRVRGGAHKLTDEVRRVRARAARGGSGAVARLDLVELIAERFGVRVHRRSIERALARAERPRTAREIDEPTAAAVMSSAMSSCASSARGRAGRVAARARAAASTAGWAHGRAHGTPQRPRLPSQRRSPRRSASGRSSASLASMALACAAAA